MRSQKATLRIIGGRWRSRKIKFIPKNVRPTTDLTRETLFNWLAPSIIGTNCLDLFAGSGALGFEALSRGAKHVVMVDTSKKTVEQLKLNAKLLETNDIDFHCLNIPKHLNKIPQQLFDIVFLDPPFYQNLIEPLCQKLQTFDYLAKNALIYIEAEKNLDIEKSIPKTWQILRQKTYGLAKTYLIRRGQVLAYSI